jgi:hypothetical protein
MSHLEQTIREVSDLRDFFIRMEPVRQAVQHEETRRAEVATKKGPGKFTHAKNAAALPSNPPAIRNADPLLRKVSDLRDLCNQVSSLNPAHRPKIAGHSMHPTGSKRTRESNKIPPAPIIRRHRPGK